MTQKLKLNKQFRRLYGRGKSFIHRSFVTYILPNKTGSVSYGITVSKKLGGAVKRNRAKRLISAAFRECAPNIKQGFDMVFVARTGIFSYKSYEIAEAMRGDLTAVGAWEENDK